MKKSVIGLLAFLLPLAGAFAQTPGEDAALPGKKPTAEQRAKAKAARKAGGAEASKSARAMDAPSSEGKAYSTSPAERKSAKARRKEEGARAEKAPKTADGPNS